MGAVAADDIAGGDRRRRVPRGFDRRREDLILTLLDRVDAHPIQNAHARRRRGGGEQHRLEVDLVAAMRRFRRRPPGVRAALRRIALGATGNLDASDLETSSRGANGDVVGIVGRQPGLAHRARNPQPAERLHRPGADDIGASDRRLAVGAHFHKRHRDAPLRQIDRQRQPDGARADDQHIGVVSLRHRSLRSNGFASGRMPEPPASALSEKRKGGAEKRTYCGGGGIFARRERLG